MAASLNECFAGKQAYSAANQSGTTQPNRGALCHRKSIKEIISKTDRFKTASSVVSSKKRITANEAASCGESSMPLITAGQGRP